MEPRIDGGLIMVDGVAPLDALYLSLYLSPLGIHLDRYDGSTAVFRTAYPLDYDGEAEEVVKAVRRAVASMKALEGKLLPAELERMLLMRGWATRRDGALIRGIMTTRSYTAYAIRVYGELADPTVSISDARVDIAVMPLSALTVDVDAYTCIISSLGSMGYRIAHAHMTYAFLEKRVGGTNMASLVHELESTLVHVEQDCRP